MRKRREGFGPEVDSRGEEQGELEERKVCAINLQGA